jgi:gamma-glutamyl-gamma-aminobutyrate hydrolase PuuD
MAAGEVLDAIDGLLLTGGEDVAPARPAKRRIRPWSTSTRRAEFESLVGGRAAATCRFLRSAAASRC